MTETTVRLLRSYTISTGCTIENKTFTRSYSSLEREVLKLCAENHSLLHYTINTELHIVLFFSSTVRNYLRTEPQTHLLSSSMISFTRSRMETSAGTLT